MKTRIATWLLVLAFANGVWAVWHWASTPIAPLPPATVQCEHLGPLETYQQPVVPLPQAWNGQH